MEPVWGKYRGRVMGNEDPMKLGRLEVNVPEIMGDDGNNWALPCVPYAGKGVGQLLVPPVGSGVWIEFEHGDTSLPIWSGGFWFSEELPKESASPTSHVLRTAGVSLRLEDKENEGGVFLEVVSPSVSDAVKVTIDSAGVVITLGSAKFTMTTSSIELAVDSAKISLTGSGLELAVDSAKMALSSSSIEQSLGAAKVALSSSSVSINDGAFEVM